MTRTRRSFFALVFLSVVFSAVGDAAAVAKMDEGDRRIFDIRDYGGSVAKAADRAIKGEVSVVGIPHAFPDGRIDWLFNPTETKGPFNPEWTWQLNRMGFWSSLAEAYSATGDEKYAQAFVRQFSDWFEQTGGRFPPTSGEAGSGLLR